MAKNKKQRALAKARKDGKVTGKEARSLRKLNVSANRITNTKRGKVTVGKAATKQAGKSRSNSTPAVNAARGNATRTSGNISRGDNQPTPTRPGTPSPGSTGNVKNGISGKQANKILRDFKQGGERLPSSSTTSIDPETGLETTTTTPGDINYDYYNNNRIYGKAKNALGIRDVNKLSELEEIKQYALSNQNPNAGKALSEYGIRGSGEFDDIVAALGGDAAAGYEVAEQMRKKGIDMLDPKYSKILGQLSKGVQGKGRFGLNSLNLSFGRLGNGKLDPVNKNKYQQDLKNTRALNGMYEGIKDAYTAPNLGDLFSSYGFGDEGGSIESAATVNDDYSDLTNEFSRLRASDNEFYQGQIDSMGMQVMALGDMADGYAATNQYLQDELNSANAYLTEADRRATNVANSFVPEANPNALSVLAGDFRKSKRKKEDNQLSDLSISTDVGSNESPLAGLQLA